MAWIDEELPEFREVTVRLAKYYRCKPVPELVEARINGRIKLNPKKLLRTTLDLRDLIQSFVDEEVNGINPKYKTQVIETPEYLTGVIPSGAAQFFDTFTKRPFQLYFQTTDPKRDPMKSVSELINLLVHEEYGHCVHHSNSVLGFVGKVPQLHLVRSLLGGPISEGLSFNRELEFFEASKRLEIKSKFTRAELAYLKMMKKYGGLELMNLEQEYLDATLEDSQVSQGRGRRPGQHWQPGPHRIYRLGEQLHWHPKEQCVLESLPCPRRRIPRLRYKLRSRGAGDQRDAEDD